MKVVMLVAAERGLRCLQKVGSLLEESDQLAVFTFPEMPWEPRFVSDIRSCSSSLGAECYVTMKVHNKLYQDVWNEKPDLVLVVGWRYLIPASVYNSATIGCFAFHDSPLPKYRGFGPTVWAMRNGEDHTGATLFKIVEGMDEGPVVAQKIISIGENDYIADTMEKVTQAYLDILADCVTRFRDGSYNLTEQDHSLATYTCKSLPTDFCIDWKDSARTILNYIRAYSRPYPGAYCSFEDKKMTIWSAELDQSHNYVGLFPGRVVKIVPGKGVLVAASDGVVLLKDVEINDSGIVNSSEIINKISTTLGD